MWSYWLLPPLWTGLFKACITEDNLLLALRSVKCCEHTLSFLTTHSQWPLISLFTRLTISFWIAYLPTYLQTSRWASRDGCAWKGIQHWSGWRRVVKWFPGAAVNLETPLNHDQQYIFCNFPHGPISVNHVLTMTDSVGFLSKHYRGERKDLVASILMVIPIVKEILLFLGCVDAGASTAHHNMKKGRSILIFIGGEKEQLLSMNNEHKVYLKSRKGFVKLAIQYGAHLVPMYCFGENECYTTSKFAMGK